MLVLVLLPCHDVLVSGISIATALSSLLFQNSHMSAVLIAIAIAAASAAGIGIILASAITATISIVHTNIRSSMMVIRLFAKPRVPSHSHHCIIHPHA